MIPRTVILDPDASVHTPEWLFLSTGIRAVDHAVEDICSVNGQPISEGAAYHALRLLGHGLPAVKADPADLDARLDCQIGAWMSMVGSQTGVSKGASHGIGHVLGGTAGVPHGYTSCVMLPHVLRFNHPVNADKQARVSEALGRPGEPAADVVAGLIAGLGLPTRLRDVGVKPEQLDLHRRKLDARPLDPHQPAQDRRTGGHSDTARRGLVGSRRHRHVDHEGRGECRGAEREQHPIGAPGVGKDVGEAVGGGRLPEREGGRAQAPGFSLLIGIVRDQLMHTAQHQRHDPRHHRADNDAGNAQ